MKTLTIDQAKAKMKSGKIFAVTFVKKDGTLRKLHGRSGVKKGVKGVGLNYDPESRGYLTVYDLRNQGFRTVNLNTLKEIKLGGKFFIRSIV